MFGTIANTIAILVGTSLGSILKQGIKERYQDALFLAMGLAASGIGLNTVIQNMPKSHYPVLFIVSLAAGSLLGAILQIDSHFNNLINRKSQSNLGKGLSTACLLHCVGSLSIIGPIMAATKGDYTMLLTNATLDLVTSMVFGASFGWGMLLAAPVLFTWQTSIYLVSKFLSATFFTSDFICELSIVGGFLILASGISLLKLRDIKTLDLLPSLLFPLIFFLGKMLF
ncbi:DUF554 domain-containing protein [Ligilactobacillus equi]|nr:DUF554 domain-containing protein [Ligilactobacillus sp.]